MKLLSTFSSLVALASATKDDTYYPAGHSNPAADDKMYWRDAQNVLGDLDQFSSLSIRYRSCAWSTIYKYTSSEDGDEDDAVYENSYWYMGLTPRTGPNVAFELYGTLKNETTTGCNRSTYINSFYTTSGYTGFISAMGLSSKFYYENGGLSSSCQSGNDGYYGVACDGKRFAEFTFEDYSCDPQKATEMRDDMVNVNAELERFTCVEIYNAANANEEDEEEAEAQPADDQVDDQADDQADDDQTDDQASSSSSTPCIETLLTYSTACSFEGGQACPDPYGKLKSWHLKLPIEIYQTQVRNGHIMMGVGLACLAVAATMWLWEYIGCKMSKSDDTDDEASSSSESTASPVIEDEMTQASSTNWRRLEMSGHEPRITSFRSVEVGRPINTVTPPASIAEEPPASRAIVKRQSRGLLGRFRRHKQTQGSWI